MEARSSYDIRDLFWIRINDCFGKTSQLFRYYSPLRSIQAFETSFNLHSRLSDRKMQLGQWNWQNHRWNTNRHRSDSIRLSFLFFFFFNQRHSDAFNKTLSTINRKCFVSEIGTSDTIKKNVCLVINDEILFTESYYVSSLYYERILFLLHRRWTSLRRFSQKIVPLSRLPDNLHIEEVSSSFERARSNIFYNDLAGETFIDWSLRWADLIEE